MRVRKSSGLVNGGGLNALQTFNPDARMKTILTDAANIGAVTALAVTVLPLASSQRWK